MGKYATIGAFYAEKSFITLTTEVVFTTLYFLRSYEWVK